MPRLIRRLLPQAVFTLPGGRDEIALTFDDGPDPEFTPRVLEVLARTKTPATFFVLGQKAEQLPGLVREIAGQGHTVGIHGYDHGNLFWRSSTRIFAEIRRADEIVAAAAGKHTRLFRPPYGRIRPGVLRRVTRAGWQVVLWDVVPYDFNAPDAPAITQRVVEHARAGSILVLHDGGGDRANTVAALPEIITRLGERYRFTGLEKKSDGTV
jgi:peptidoglycan/xylan/chitin deacetylase (PgdA/CDA1 family)